MFAALIDSSPDTVAEGLVTAAVILSVSWLLVFVLIAWLVYRRT